MPFEGPPSSMATSLCAGEPSLGDWRNSHSTLSTRRRK